MAAERMDSGDIDAALGRIDIYAYPHDVSDAVCDCGWVLPLAYEQNLLALVNKIAEHSKTCRKRTI